MVSKYFLPHDDTDDNYDLWDKFPNHRWIHNKLELALLCGHNAGPIPILPKESGYYILRPIYNLIGLGLNAKKVWIDKDDIEKIHDYHPGEFWCEWFEGPHYSIDYEWNNGWQPIFATQGFNSADNLIQFTRWNKIDPPNILLPDFLDKLKDIKFLNIEFKDSKIIEVHLRLGNIHGDWHNIEDASVIVPAWKSKYMKEALAREQQGWKFVYDYDHAFAGMTDPRLGFWYI